jgi:TonB family protein
LSARANLEVHLGDFSAKWVFAPLLRQQTSNLSVLNSSFCSVGGTAAKVVEVPNSEKGFNSQYRKFVDDYWRAKKENRGNLFVQFAIPKHWFADTFGADQAPGLVNEYLEPFDDFVSSTARRLAGTSPCPDCAVDLKTKLMASVAINVGSIQLPPVQQFVIHYQSIDLSDRMNPRTDGDSSWMDSFVYLDGAFRFYGKGGSTFFDPVRVRLADPCSRNGVQPGGTLIHRVEPEYPEQARAKHIAGFVKMLLTVAPDGSVNQVKVIEGDPLLVEAATKAAMQWKYTPFMRCGKPVEMQSSEHVHFPPVGSP